MDGVRPDPGFALGPRRGGTWIVKLSAELPPAWCGHLSLGLARRGISIQRGFAKRSGGELWTAELHVRAAAPESAPDGLDYVALARAEPGPGALPTPALDSYYVDGSPESGEFLFLEVRGRDQVGFLGGLLERLRGLSLFPEQVSIQTWEDQAYDRFHLKPLGRQSSREDMARGLSETLDGLMAPGSSR